MKPFLLSQLCFAIIAGSLAASIAMPGAGFANLAGFSLWLLIVVSLVVTLAMHSQISDAEKGHGEKRAKGLEVCRGLIEKLDKRSIPCRALGWAESVVIVALAAYVGRFWGAGFYVLAVMLVLSAETAARQVLAKTAEPVEA